MENNGEEKGYIPNRVIPKESLKTYFENGDIPEEQNFWEWQDSYWHKNDPQDVIPSDRVDLSGKADKNATNLDGENVLKWRAKLNIQDPDHIGPVSNTQSGIVDNTALQELGGADKLVHGVRIGTGEGSATEWSTALGRNALIANTTGENNNAFGRDALAANTTGVYNTALGDYSLPKNTNGVWNTAVGSSALNNNSTGQRNVAFSGGLYWNTSGSHNVAGGMAAGYANSSGSYNTYLGRAAGYDNGLGSYNVGVGSLALILNGGGWNTGGSTVNMNRNVFIGSYLRGASTQNDTLAVDNKGGTITDAQNALLYGGFSLANRFLKINGTFSVNPAYIPNAQGDITYAKQITAKADGTFGWEDRGIPTAFVSPVTLGGISAGYTVPKGTELLSFMQMLLNATQYPSYTNPSQTFTNDRGIVNGGIYEIGTTFSNVTFSKTYAQGIIRGRTVNGIWEANTEQGKRSGALVSFTINGTDIGVNQSLNLGNVIVAYGTNTITSAASYAKGDQPVDSMGNNFQTPLPAAAPEMNISFSGVFKAFYGNTAAATVATGAEVRLLPNANMISTLKKVILVTGNTNVNYHVFLPSSFVVTKVIDLSNSNQDITDRYELLGTFEVPDAAGTPRTYMHYRMINSAPYSASHNHEITFN